MIILAVMVVVIIYGVFDFLSPKSKQANTLDPAARRAELTAFVNEFTAGLAKGASGKQDAYVVGKAQAEWVNNPFSDGKLYASWKGAKTPATATAATAAAAKPVFTYTGFIEGETKKMAIINDVEYGIGDAMDVKGYIVRYIFPDKVVIFHKGEKKTITVPLQE